MDEHLLEALLHEDEGSALDFKRDQYPFDGADDNTKSELLKDVLAFANAWRRTDAYILIGVEEVRGSRSRPVGVSAHLDDARLQQFVNSKTQRPVQLAYQAGRVDGADVGVVRIPIQPRPLFLRRDFGKLKKDVVYLRHGSSTGTADPDEIARMAAATNLETSAQLTVHGRILGAYQGTFVVQISNATGAGDARAPYLELLPPGPFMVSAHGVDGTSRQHGLPLVPQGEGSALQKFAGTSDVILHAGTSRDIAVIIWKGGPDKVPSAVDVPYVVGALGVPAVSGTLAVALRAG
jgi:hypothetical protein